VGPTGVTIEGHLDTPRDGATLKRGAVLIEGWAVIDGAPPTSVVVTANDTVVGSARVGTSRPDVAAGFNNPALEHCGFVLTVDLSAFSDGALTISATTFSSGDPIVLGSSTIHLVVDDRTGSKTFEEDDLRDLAGGWWYYSVELLPGLVSAGADRHGVPMLTRILMRGCDLTDMDCLDMGSMEGLIPVLMKRRGARTVLATDFDDWLIEKLDAVKFAYGVDFEFRSVGLMYELYKTLEGRSFDFINCSGLLYHTWSPLHVLAGTRPLLRRNGQMLISTYVSFEEGEYQQFNSRGQFVSECNTFWYMSVGMLDYALRYLRLEPLDMNYLRSDQLPIDIGFPPPDGKTGYLSVLCRATDDPPADPWMRSSAEGSIEYKHGTDWGIANSQPRSAMKSPAVLNDIRGKTLVEALNSIAPTSMNVSRSSTTTLALQDWE
jgi:2-polyprenyl-3-methyl-5-hydroxy-6-metoxy-1,4-benzoquinol methylase